jgi:putative oxidoreductase
MKRTMTDDLGKLVLRVSVGVLILLHGIFKLQNGVDGIAGMLGNHGLPALLAYGVYIGEVVGPALVILGVFTRIGALLIAGNMLVAFLLAHMQELFSLGKMGGWALELQGMFLLGAIAIALLGAGRFSVGGIAGRYN